MVLPLPFSFFFSLSEYCMARTFNIMLNKSGENGHSCPVPGLRGKLFSLSPFELTVGLSYMTFNTLS